jgi:hypothetical protein
VLYAGTGFFGAAFVGHNTPLYDFNQLLALTTVLLSCLAGSCLVLYAGTGLSVTRVTSTQLRHCVYFGSSL